MIAAQVLARALAPSRLRGTSNLAPWSFGREFSCPSEKAQEFCLLDVVQGPDRHVTHALPRPFQQIRRELRALHEVEIDVLAVLGDGGHPYAIEGIVWNAPLTDSEALGMAFLIISRSFANWPLSLGPPLRRSHRRPTSGRLTWLILWYFKIPRGCSSGVSSSQERHNYGAATSFLNVVRFRVRRREAEEAVRSSASTRKQEEEEGIQGKARRAETSPEVRFSDEAIGRKAQVSVVRDLRRTVSVDHQALFLEHHVQVVH